MGISSCRWKYLVLERGISGITVECGIDGSSRDIGIKKAGVTAVLGLHKAIYKVHATKVTTTNFTAG